ncbi:hypothetical protein [Kineococcus arenarius]|uniref:hypothetical protein n=1 Tax=unclassified Kineococcus TaxID=2621656 RepID=UPI003D7C50D9
MSPTPPPRWRPPSSPHLAADVVLCSRVPASPDVPPGTVEVGGSAWHGHAGPLAALTVLDDLERVLLG